MIPVILKFGSREVIRSTGIEGLRIADKILKKYNVSGLLVGGLAKAFFFSANLEQEYLNFHSDIDVVILSSDCQAHHPMCYEGGIDWFLCHQENVSKSSPEFSTQYFPVSATGVFLPWKIGFDKSLKPGLYFPSALNIIAMTEAEINCNHQKLKEQLRSWSGTCPTYRAKAWIENFSETELTYFVPGLGMLPVAINIQIKRADSLDNLTKITSDFHPGDIPTLPGGVQCPKTFEMKHFSIKI